MGMVDHGCSFYLPTGGLTAQVGRLAWYKGRQPSGAVLHSSREPAAGELLQ